MSTVPSSFDEYIRTLKNELEVIEEKYEFIQELPDLLKLYVSLLDDRKELEREEKLQLLAVFGYVFSPKDVIPENVHGPIGYMDDFFLCIETLRRLMNSRKDFEELVKEDWHKESNIQDIVEEGLQETKRHLGREKRKKIRSFVGSPSKR